MSRIRNFERKFFAALRRPAPAGWVQRSAFWLLLICVASGLLGMLPGTAGDVFQGIFDVLLVPLVILAAILLVQFVFGRFLWKVRNRLIVTYVLMGLAPVVLFATLAGVALYIFSGQFAIFAGTAEEHTELVQIAAENRIFASRIADEIKSGVPLSKLSLPEAKNTVAMRDFPDLRLAVFVDGKLVHVAPDDLDAVDIPNVPRWVGEKDFAGTVFDKKQLYLRAVNTSHAGDRPVSVVSSLLLGEKNLDRIAAGLGSVVIFPNANFVDGGMAGGQVAARKTSRDKYRVTLSFPGTEDTSQQHAVDIAPGGLDSQGAIVGGQLPETRHFYDPPVAFTAPLSTTNWETGDIHEALVHVNSRPSLLYQRLFNTSLRVGYMFRDVLIALAIFFGFLEMVAFYGAMKLNRTITKSVRDLYKATEAIDHGDFEHRIVVKRRDQLAALSQSFNNMASSLARLLKEQEEKQKMQSELAIAQEVQANLYPGANLQLGRLDVYGVCLPARTVSGDYYDFLVLSDKALSIALGDISGKGISAALLMATLHSAVRAYRFAGNEMALAAQHLLAKEGKQDPAFEAESGRLFTEPASMLRLLNHHLYRSTQPEKYATLFLAHMDVETRNLTYANGGHLPPLLLRHDGSVDRMDRGGTVVGLIDNVVYEQGAAQMHPGDILIAYSDGVTEPENEFGDFGEDRLVDVVRRHRHLPLDVIANQVIHALRGWIGDQEQPDDITLVLARCEHASG